MSEATRKFAAIVCAELAGKVDVNDFRFGSWLCKNADTETDCATIESRR